jgi:Dyp-type peroxidase family
LTDLDRADIQGIVLSAYGHLTCAAYLMLRIREAQSARSWLASVAGEITDASGKQEGFSLNLALTYEGLQALGLDPDALATFPVPFTEGMASPKRSHILGDTNKDAPANWDWGGEKNPVHILLMVFGAEEDALAAQLKLRREELARFGGVEEVLQLSAGRQPDSHEHFGFNDGIAQPVIEGSGRKQRQLQRTGHTTEVKPGEFVLGYVNEYDIPADCPTVDPARDPQGLLRPYEYPPQLLDDNVPPPPPRRNLGINGSYLVFRQLEQNVPAFWNFVADSAREIYGAESGRGEAAIVRLASKFVGRWPSGAPLVKSPDRDDPQLSTDNNFGYASTDREGLACPVGSHIRRSNPRDSLGDNPKAASRAARRHRLMRRGRSYGHRIADRYTDDGQERGLHFICLNSELDRQFEFVQQTWLNNPVFGGLYDETDPLVGNQDKDKCSAVFTVPGAPVRVRVHNLCSFLSVRGGAYFFLPGLSALRYLGSLNG